MVLWRISWQQKFSKITLNVSDDYHVLILIKNRQYNLFTSFLQIAEFIPMKLL